MKNLRTGYTTGTCAAAAAKAAALLLTRNERRATVEVLLPEGMRVCLPVERLCVSGDGVRASVRKDAGDDPDATNGVLVEVLLSPAPDGGVSFAAGEGVGTVTKPGLSVKPGEPAINPVPRLMIEGAIREVTPRGMLVTVSVPGGRKIARRTFNPRLGIEGGLSVLGTTGIVRPYSISSVRASLTCALDVAVACAIKSPVFVPGNLGRKAVERNFSTRDQQVIEAGNEWGFVVDAAVPRRFEKILVAGHPGKLVKLAAGYWDTHSARSGRAHDIVARRAELLFRRPLPGQQVTAEGIFSSLSAEEAETLGNSLAGAVRGAILARMETKSDSAGTAIPVLAVALTDMQGRIRGTAGELAPWR
jgi:cobalt-precorrin-5B (C1)-methyltransferase